MAYDPYLTSFILVGIVGGVAVIMSTSADWEVTFELARATNRWTRVVVVRRYDNDAPSQTRLSKEATILQAHGYKALLRRLMTIGDVDIDADAATPNDPSAKIVVTYQLD